jgi:hypothetical protein
MHGGVCILDCLSKADIMELLEKQYERMLELEAEEADPAAA